MSSLKVLKLRKSHTLSAPNLKNLELDKLIIQNRLSGELSSNQFCIKHSIKGMKLAGRVTSLVKRNHIVKGSKPTFKDLPIVTKNNNDNYLPLSGNLELKSKIINDINNGKSNISIQKKFEVSQSTVSRIKRALKNDINNVSIKKVTKDTDTYNENNGVNKEVARNKMAKYIVDSNVEGTIPTLPYKYGTIEKKILAQNENYDFIGVEKLPKVYDVLVETIKNEKLPIKPYLGDFCDKIYGAKENQYAHIIGDYCGELPTFANEVEYAVTNKIVKVGGIMALTFGKPIRSKCLKSDSIFKLGSFITNHDKDVRSQSDKAIEGYFQRLIGFNFELTEIFNYHDDKGKGKGYPMVLVILKRLR